MAGCVRNRCVLLLLLVIAVLPSIKLLSQDFKTLFVFPASNNGTNSDGSSPLSGVILINNTLYGTTTDGGSGYAGTVYAVKTDGTAFHLSFTFAGDLGQTSGDFVISGNSLYTTSSWGGPYAGTGAIIEVPIDGTSQVPSNWYGFEPLFGDGTHPDGVIMSDSLLYGVTLSGGQFGYGTVYAYDGSVVTTLYSFAGNEGANPNGSLVLYNGIFYGVTRLGGSGDNGTVFSLTADGSGFKTLHHFSGWTNGEGANPLVGLTLWSNTLFGTTSSGGASSNGTIFRVSTTGTGFTSLHSFTGGSDGAKPAAALNLSGNTLYGTTSDGGAWGWGTVFAVGTDGNGFATLHSFNAVEGASPLAKMVLSSNTLYGTTFKNSTTGNGTVFSLWLGVAPPQLSITPSGPNIVLTWPATGNFFLQSATNLVSAPVWTKVSTGPIVISGLNTVTNSISEAKRFFRLSQ